MRDSLTRRRPGGNHLHRSSQRDHDPPPRLVNRMVPSHPMAHDVFISYAKGDRPRAAELASALEAHAWSVWWDRDIPPGRTFDDVIEEALTSARSVVVLWSAESVKSRWVRTEASAAAERGALVPALIAPVTIPLEFRRLEAADLTAWHGERTHPELQQLVETLAGLIESDTRRIEAPGVKGAAAGRPAQRRCTCMAFRARSVHCGRWTRLCHHRSRRQVRRRLEWQAFRFGERVCGGSRRRRPRGHPHDGRCGCSLACRVVEGAHQPAVLRERRTPERQPRTIHGGPRSTTTPPTGM